MATTKKKVSKKKTVTTTLSDIQKASESVQSFCEDFGATVTTSNQKKGLKGTVWTSRVTKNFIQLKVITGSNPLEAMMKTSEFCSKRKKELGL